MSTKEQKDKPLDFENALRELEALVEDLEDGELTLEDALKRFERGVALTRICQKALSAAEQKVSILTEKDGKSIIEPVDLIEENGENQ